jgi:lipopolysaccharide/colanic/teichoic acid biosynthesis glycosyltransferase
MAASSLSFTGTLPVASVTVSERIAAGVALVAAGPGLLAVMGLVRVMSGRAPLVAHQRVGQFGQPLWVFKIRTMWGHAEGVGQGWIEYLQDPALPPAKSGVDPRVTSRFAAFCRRHSIDELPQLFHVAAGSMRWVGPRPMTRVELDEHYAAVQAELLSVPPGLTGLWQVLGRNRLSYAQRRRLDLLLVRRFGWRLCAHVLARTVKEVILPRYAW